MRKTNGKAVTYSLCETKVFPTYAAKIKTKTHKTAVKAAVRNTDRGDIYIVPSSVENAEKTSVVSGKHITRAYVIENENTP